MILNLAEYRQKMEKQRKEREEFFTIRQGLRAAGETPTFSDVLGVKEQVLEIQRVMARRSTETTGLYEAAKAHPAVMRIFWDMKSITKHTTLGAAARRFVAEQERQKWRTH